MENLDRQTGTREVSTSNRIEEMENRVLGVKDTIEEIDFYKSKKMLNLKENC